jgi:hypothetical protein
MIFQTLTTAAQRAYAHRHISELFSQHAEWLCSVGQTEAHSLHRNEIEISISNDRLMLSCWTEKGTRTWRILEWYWNGEILLLQGSRKMGAELPLIELIPRASALAIAATIRAARQARCNRLAELACLLEPQTKIERATLSPGVRRGQPGRFARILLRRKRERIAVTGPVVVTHVGGVDAFLSAALLWFQRTSERIRPPYIGQLWLVVSKDILNPTTYRVSLLRDSLRQIIKLYVVDDELTSLELKPCAERKELWKKRLAQFPPVPPASMTPETLAIVDLAPEAIDVVHARHGETIRYFGLPFARVRSLMGVERVWFGIEGSHRRMLDDASVDDWKNLLDELRLHRSAGALDHRHALYRNAAEAWLESLLRKDITKLDPGLIIAPLHAQFRTARGGKLGIRPIDMLALRQDGRLVVIELKVSEDREHVLQGADYWRRVEAHRRRGHISKAKLFGDKRIRDEPPLVYLIAPTLRVHPAFSKLARCIAPDIEIYRFDINEDWRAGVRVMRRMRVN